MDLFKKIKKQAGDKRDFLGLCVSILNRQRMYFSMLGISFLVSDRLLAIFQIDWGITEYIKGLPGWMVWVVSPMLILGWFAFIYIDLKFIWPGEVMTSHRRSRILMGIYEKTK